MHAFRDVLVCRVLVIRPWNCTVHHIVLQGRMARTMLLTLPGCVCIAGADQLAVPKATHSQEATKGWPNRLTWERKVKVQVQGQGQG